MPRNASGTYTLPAGNPVISNTLIETAWANPTLNDLAAAITDSLDRYGRGGMLAAFKIADGTVTAPGLSFVAQSNLGIYRSGTDRVAGVAGGSEAFAWSATAFEILRPVSHTGAALFDDGTAALPSAAFKNSTTTGIFRNGADNIGFSTAATLRMQLNATGLGIGTAPATKLHVSDPNVAFRGQLTLQGGASDFSQISFYRGATTNTDQVGFLTSANAAGSLRMTLGARNGGYITLETSDVERLRLLALAGRSTLLVGTTASTFDTSGRSVIELEGSTEALLGFKTAGVGRAYLQAGVSSLNVATAGPWNINIAPNGSTQLAVGTNGISLTGLLVDLPAAARVAYITSDTSPIRGATIANYGLTVGATMTGLGLATCLSGYGGLSFVTGGAEVANITNAGFFFYGGNEIGFRKLVVNTPANNSTLGGAQSGQGVYGSFTNLNVSGPGVFSRGDMVTIYQDGATSMTLTPTGSMTLRLAGTTTTGTRTIAARGICTVLFNSGTEAVVSGPGVS